MHSYFVDQIPYGLKIVPSASTLSLFRNYRMMPKYSQNGIDILYEFKKDEDNCEPVIKFDEIIRMQFYILNNDALFLNYTDLSFFKIKSKILYFTNINNESKSLSKNEFVTDDDLFEKQGKTFNSVPNASILNISDLNGNKVGRVWKTNESDSTNVIDLQWEKDSKYIIQYDSGVSSEIVSVNYNDKSLIGLTEIFLNAEILDKIDQETPEYYLTFKSREVYLNFCVFEKYGKYKDLKMTNENDEEVFDFYENIDSHSFEFTTKEKFLLKNKMDLSYKIISANGLVSSKKTIKEKMPMPELSNLKKYNNKENEFVFDIFLYI